MWWVGSSPLDVYLGTRYAAICRGTERLWASGIGGLDDGLGRLRAQLAANTKPHRLRVWVSGGLCRPFLLPAVEGLRGAGEAQQIARAMAPKATGLTPPCEVWVEPRSGSGAQVAVAIARPVVDAVLALSTGRGRRVVSVRPWWSEVLRAATASGEPPTAVSVRDCDSVTILLGQGDTFEAAATVAPVLDDDSARAAFARATMSSDLEVAKTFAVSLRLDRTGGGSFGDRLALGAWAEANR